MIPQIDWYAFTLPTYAPIGGIGRDSLQQAYHAFDALDLQWILPDVSDVHWEIFQGRGFYKVRWQEPYSRISISWGNQNPHIFVEMDGHSCAALRENNILERVINATAAYASRIDCSVDFESKITPLAFARTCHNDRILARGYMKSESGETCYVGARQSQRFARVYRFYEPHPRAAFLRVESEYKGTAAKALAALLADSSIEGLVLSAHAYFRWTHPMWTTSLPHAISPHVPVRDKAGSGRTRWLLRVAFPALLKAHKEGTLDLRKMIDAEDLG